ncbi:hypothetical protein AB0M72_07705 [Nocardiopsis dassonvillei]
MNEQRPSLFVRIRAYARRNPVGYGVVNGILAGIPFGTIMAVTLWSTTQISDPLRLVGAGVALGVFFGAGMGVFAVLMVRAMPKEPLPPETDRARLREAGRLVRQGTPGADPVVNQIARQQAETVLGQPYWPKTMATVFGLGLALNLWSVTYATGPGFWGNVVGLVVFPLMLFVAMPITARQRRRARAFLTALEEDPGSNPDA